MSDKIDTKIAVSNGRWEHAKRYAAAEPSDPFLLARIAAHMRNGVAGYRQAEPDIGGEAFYSAHEGTETRTYEGEGGQAVSYQAVVYSQRRRP